jgi:hypothetical protein
MILNKWIETEEHFFTRNFIDGYSEIELNKYPDEWLVYLFVNRDYYQIEYDKIVKGKLESIKKHVRKIYKKLENLK